MKTIVDRTSFGSITINGKEYHHDVIIRLAGKVEKRRKKLSKQVYGTSHKMSLEEAEDIYENGCETVAIGTGQHGMLKSVQKIVDFFADHGCNIILKKTPEAIEEFNLTSGKKIGVFHITC
ncbi:MAG: hypothetical protein GY801_03995 [bacterium]|nr:hypothetical protein [bacterium]